MSDYHRIYLKLSDLVERGHTVQVDKRSNEFEVTVFEGLTSRDHVHVQDQFLSDAMDTVHAIAIARWPREDD